MFRSGEVKSYIAGALKGATPGLVEEARRNVANFDSKSRLSQTWSLADHYAQLGMPSIAAAYLSLTPRRSWRSKAEFLSQAYKNRSEKTLAHLSETHIENPYLVKRSDLDHQKAEALLALSQYGRRTTAQQIAA